MLGEPVYMKHLFGPSRMFVVSLDNQRFASFLMLLDDRFEGRILSINAFCGDKSTLY
jgi:hypothetical protein